MESLSGDQTEEVYPDPMAQLSDDAVLLALLRARPDGMNWNQIAQGILAAGSAADLLDELANNRDGDGTLFAVEPAGIDQAALDRARADLEDWQAQGLGFLAVNHPQFPARVRSIREVPPFLTFRGELREVDAGISVVGSRKASPTGRRMAAAIATALARHGYTVLSGLAEGIDAAAHTAALESGGRTVAFIGTGLNRSYPAANKDLQKRIADEGLLLSQFYPDGPPQRHNFLMRNAVMSGYGRATVVVEAGEHSGARAQARMAVEHGRPVILTDFVVERNEWARSLVGRSRVYVASSVPDVMAAVDAIAAGESEAADIVARLVPEFA
jgi:DNA processing protein